MADVQDIVRISRDMDAIHDTNPEKMVALVAKVTAEVEDALGLRLTELDAAGTKVGKAKVVVGDPRWDTFTDNDGALRLRATAQGHLEY